jgi:hypothetical protein
MSSPTNVNSENRLIMLHIWGINDLFLMHN